MPMKRSWFHHLECTTQQAEELVARYRQRGVKVERSLNPDFMTWTVSAQLVEEKIRRGQILAGVTGCGGEYGEPSQRGPRPRMHSADPWLLQRQPGNQRAGALPPGGYVRHRMQAGRHPGGNCLQCLPRSHRWQKENHRLYPRRTAPDACGRCNAYFGDLARRRDGERVNEYRISFRIECHIHDRRHRGPF